MTTSGFRELNGCCSSLPPFCLSPTLVAFLLPTAMKYNILITVLSTLLVGILFYSDSTLAFLLPKESTSQPEALNLIAACKTWNRMPASVCPITTLGISKNDQLSKLLDNVQCQHLKPYGGYTNLNNLFSNYNSLFLNFKFIISHHIS